MLEIERLGRFGLIAAVFSLCSCIHFPGAEQKKSADAPAEAAYRLVKLTKALNPAGVEKRVHCVVEFVRVEDGVLDLPDRYHEWVRVLAQDPGNPESRTSSIVVPEKDRKLVSSLKTGERVDLFASVVSSQDGAELWEEGPPTLILRVDKIRRNRKDASPAQDAPVENVTYVNNRDPKAFLLLESGGAFTLREKGRELKGAYRREDGGVVFILPGGKTASASLGEDTLTDPDGKEWILKEDNAQDF